MWGCVKTRSSFLPTPLNFIWEVVLRKKLCFFLKTISQKNIIGCVKRPKDFLHNPKINTAPAVFILWLNLRCYKPHFIKIFVQNQRQYANY